MSALLEVRDLEKSWGPLKAVDGLSFSVSAGEAFGLLGPNGAGKSTTMMMISGLLQPDSGTVALNGQPLNHRIPASRQLLGVVPQDLAIYPDLTARENLNFFASLYHLPADVRRQRVAAALEQVGLSGRADDPASEFSGGMKRRLNFAAAVLHEPSLLILDEPTVGVDPQSRAHLLDCVRTLQQNGTAIIYASHYMEEVQAICSRAAIVDHGRMLACDRIERLLQQIPLEVEIRVGGAGGAAAFSWSHSAAVEEADGETIIRLRADDRASESVLNREVTAILTAIAEQGFGVRSIRTQEPSLERLFLKLTGNSLRD